MLATLIELGTNLGGVQRIHDISSMNFYVEQVAGFGFNSASFMDIGGAQHLNFTHSLQPNDTLDPRITYREDSYTSNPGVTVINEEDTR